MIWQAIEKAYSVPERQMRVSQVKDAAEAHGVNMAWAIERRTAYLLAQKLEVMGLIHWCCENESEEDGLEFLLADVIIRLTQRKGRIEKEMRQMRGYLDPPKTGSITDDMIAQAKEYPVDQLIEFDKGKAAKAWCHPESSPTSLTWWVKGNRAKCWPCGKSFNAIDILMSRDGMSFVEAVRTLCR